MKHIDEYQDPAIIKKLLNKICSISHTPVNLMEVCGGHTMAIQRFGIPSLLPGHIRLISGPGCPVCVTSIRYIDKAIALSQLPENIIATYGDLIRVPGSLSTLNKERAAGKDIRIVYSSMDALKIAKVHPEKNVIFLGIGFETTAPATAAAILKAKNENFTNFYAFSSHKIMPPAMEALIDEGVNINGYIAPGHVTTVTGTHIYDAIPEKFGLGVVVSGFEPADLLQAICMLVEQIENNDPKVETAYKRVVKHTGNIKAQEVMNEVFEYREDWWRGIGILPDSGLGIRNKYREYDAEQVFDVQTEPVNEPKGCICGEILKGLKTPIECTLFAKACTPENPVGACMVSGEGACQAYYRYSRAEVGKI
jgi:hydrogenase expression/formation protein HypD